MGFYCLYSIHFPMKDTQDESKTCALCNSNHVEAFFHLPNMPTQDGLLADSYEDSLSFPIGTIQLSLCTDCGYVANEGYDPNKITFDTYDFSLNHSPTFREYVEQLTDRLCETYQLSGKTLLEIGCGDGHVLSRLKEKGDNIAFGIDPGFDFSQHQPSFGQRLYLIRDYYSPHFAFLRPDFVMCRLVIDLLPDPVQFLKMLRRNLDHCPDAVLYMEVPNAVKNFSDAVLWNMAYEHRSWFTPESLRYLFELCGFKVLNIETCWQEEFLAIEATPTYPWPKPGRRNEDAHQSFLQSIKNFSHKTNEIQQAHRHRLEEISSKQQKLAMWGAGARGVTFLNMFQMNGEVNQVVDINPRRHGKYMPGTGHQVAAPESLIELAPDVLLINNPTYAEEIMAHAKELGLKSEFWVL